jgi:hypothetical protein
MHELTLQNVLVLLTLQLAVFGWRINREIAVGDQGRRTWFPVNDWLNVLSMLFVVVFCVIEPLAAWRGSGGTALQLPRVASAVFGGGSVLLVFHPLAMVAHYGLLNRKGRNGFLKNPDDDYPPFPVQERVVTAVSVVAALGVAWLVVHK